MLQRTVTSPKYKTDDGTFCAVLYIHEDFNRLIMDVPCAQVRYGTSNPGTWKRFNEELTKVNIQPVQMEDTCV